MDRLPLYRYKEEVGFYAGEAIKHGTVEKIDRSLAKRWGGPIVYLVQTGTVQVEVTEEELFIDDLYKERWNANDTIGK